MAVKLRQAGGALWRALLSSICTRWYPTPHGLRRPLCFYNGLGRLLLRCRAYFELKIAPNAPSRRFLRVVSLEAPEPDHQLVARIREDYEMCMRLESGALSEVWARAAQTFETEQLNATTLRQFRRNAVGDSGYMSGGLIGTDWKPRLEVALLYHRMAAIADPFLLSCVSENPAGSIECVEYRGQLLSSNLVRHAAFVGRIAQHVNLASRLTVLEIGGGYGGLARLLKRESPRSTVILVDIPSSLALATYFLSESCPGARVATVSGLPPSGPIDVGSSEYDFVLLPEAWLARLPNGCVDLVVNTTSFQEMPRETIGSYFAEIHRLSRGHFYCYNRLFTPRRYGGVSFAEYPFDDRWRTLSQAISPEGHFEWIGRRV